MTRRNRARISSSFRDTGWGYAKSRAARQRRGILDVAISRIVVDPFLGWAVGDFDRLPFDGGRLWSGRFAEIISTVNWQDGTDGYAHLTSRALSQSQPKPGTVTIGVISASAMREAISDSDILTKVASSSWQTEVDFANLTAPNMTLWEAVIVADCIADGYHGIVLIAVAPNKLARRDQRLDNLLEEPRMGICSTTLDAELSRSGVQVPRRTGVLLFDNIEFYAARRYALLHNAFAERDFAPQMQLVRTKSVTLDAPAMHRRINGWKNQLAQGYYESAEANLDLIRLAIQRLKQSGQIQVVLVEEPFNPLGAEMLFESDFHKSLRADYESSILALAQELEVEYWDVAGAAKLTATDFIDEFHMGNPAARQRFTEELARRLAALPASEPPPLED